MGTIVRGRDPATGMLFGGDLLSVIDGRAEVVEPTGNVLVVPLSYLTHFTHMVPAKVATVTVKAKREAVPA